MKTQTFKGSASDAEHRNKAFDPMTQKPNDGTATGLKPVCICGYELIKESDGTFRCTGGSHRYLMDEGQVEYDKFGNLLLKIPEAENENKEEN